MHYLQFMTFYNLYNICTSYIEIAAIFAASTFCSVTNFDNDMLIFKPLNLSTTHENRTPSTLRAFQSPVHYRILIYKRLHNHNFEHPQLKSFRVRLDSTERVYKITNSATKQYSFASNKPRTNIYFCSASKL